MTELRLSDPSESTSRLRRAASGKQPPNKGSRTAAARAGVFLVLALLAAAATALLTTRYVDRRLSGAKLATTTVVVAAADLPLATTLTLEALTTVEWPSDGAPAGAVAEPQELVGRVVVSRIVKGEPVLAVRLAARDAGSGLSAVLPAEMRAVAVRVDDVVGVAGFIHPGDTVDVIVTMKPSDRPDVLPVAKVILQNVRVLAVGKQLEAERNASRKPIEATVATLMVDSLDAEKLALATNRGKLLLALRSVLDTSELETPGIMPPALLGEVLAVEPPPVAAPRPQPRSAPKAKSEPAPQKEVVEILRGQKLEERRLGERGGNK